MRTEAEMHGREIGGVKRNWQHRVRTGEETEGGKGTHARLLGGKQGLGCYRLRQDMHSTLDSVSPCRLQLLFRHYSLASLRDNCSCAQGHTKDILSEEQV